MPSTRLLLLVGIAAAALAAGILAGRQWSADRAAPVLRAATLLPVDAPSESRARLDAFMQAFTRYNLEWEPQLRSALRLSLEPGATAPALRQGRAIGWIEDALAPLRTSHPEIDVRALAVAIRSATRAG